MKAPFLIVATGNPSRGDDALGPLLLARIADWLAGSPLASRFELIEDFQLQIEHALDLAGRQRVLFIDAGMRTPGPYRFFEIQPAGDMAHTTHALSPEAVLAVCGRIGNEAPPPAFVLCLRGESFVLGEPLSTTASHSLAAAFAFLVRVFEKTEVADWRTASYNSN